MTWVSTDRPLVLFRSEAHLSDILVSDSANLLDVCGALGNLLDVVAHEDKLILLSLGGLDVDTVLHDDLSHDLLAQEVSVRVSQHVAIRYTHTVFNFHT